MELELSGQFKSWYNPVVNNINATSFALTTNPTAGYVLTSDSKGNGTWQAASSGNTFSSVMLNGSSNQLVFLPGNTGNSVTINASTPAQNTILNLPNAGQASSNFVLTDSSAAQTITSLLTLSNAVTFTDASNPIVLQPGGSGHTFTINASTPGTNTTLTIPDPGSSASSFVLSSTTAGQTISGPLVISNGGSSSIGICTGGFTGVLGIGNAGMSASSTMYISNLNGVAAININDSSGNVNIARSGSSSVNIQTSGSTGTINIGNASSTLNLNATTSFAKAPSMPNPTMTTGAVAGYKLQCTSTGHAVWTPVWNSIQPTFIGGNTNSANNSSTYLGYGTTFVLTTGTSGLAWLSIRGWFMVGTIPGGVVVRTYYGTGTAPAGGSTTLTGTQWGPTQTNAANAAGDQYEYTAEILVQLTASTAYWVDFAIQASGSVSVDCFAPEFRVTTALS